jgi:hypothetical protein
MIYPSDEVLISEKNLQLLRLMQCANWKTMFHYGNALISYEAYYASKAPKPNKNCPKVMDFKTLGQ